MPYSVTGFLQALFYNLSNASLDVCLYMISAILFCVCSLISIHLGFVLLNPEYELRHFLRTEARINSRIAYFSDTMAKIWNDPDRVENNTGMADNTKTVEVHWQEVKLGMKFKIDEQHLGDR